MTHAARSAAKGVLAACLVAIVSAPTSAGVPGPARPAAGPSAPANSGLLPAFDAITAGEWRLPRSSQRAEIPIALKVSNLGRQPFAVSLGGAVLPAIAMPSGTPPQFAYAPGRHSPSPQTVSAGRSLDIPRTAQLTREKNGSLTLAGSDGAGGTWKVEGLRAGRYQLRMIYDGGAAKPGMPASQITGRFLTTAVPIVIRED